MRAVVQRVRRAQVRVGDEVAGDIGPGLLVLLGVGNERHFCRRRLPCREDCRPPYF